MKTIPPLTALEFGGHLERIAPHIDRANGWASEQFRRFPRLDAVSLTLGASFGLQFTVTLTWNRATNPGAPTAVEITQED